MNLSGPQTNDSKYTINQVFDLHDPLDTIPLSKLEIGDIFLPPTDKITLELLKRYQNLDSVIRQLKSWHKYKNLARKSRYHNFRKQNTPPIFPKN